MPAPGEPDAVPYLRQLVNHGHVVELPDALSHGPMTFAALQPQVRTSRRALAAALRLVGARGLVTRTDNGTWDTQPPVDAVYQRLRHWAASVQFWRRTTNPNTDLGRRVLEALSRFSVWTAMYDRTDAAEGHSWNVTHSGFGEQVHRVGRDVFELASRLRQIHPQIVGLIGVGRAPHLRCPKPKTLPL